MASKRQKPQRPAPGTYPPPPGYQWVWVPKMPAWLHILFGVGGLFTFGAMWLIWPIFAIAERGQRAVLRPIQVTYVAPMPMMPVQAPQLPPFPPESQVHKLG